VEEFDVVMRKIGDSDVSLLIYDAMQIDMQRIDDISCDKFQS
jgi:hypothetical protein